MPETLVGLVVFAAGVGPGYVYIRIAERWTPRRERSALQEAAELVVVGATATALAVLAILALGHSTGGIDANQLIADRLTYLVKEPVRSLLALVAILVLSYGVVALIAFLVYTPLRVPAEERKRIRPSDTVWYGAFSRDLPEKHAAWLSVETHDARLISGVLRAFPTDENDRRELVLAPPLGGHIEIEDPVAKTVTKLSSERLVVGESEIRNIHVRYLPLAPSRANSQRLR